MRIELKQDEDKTEEMENIAEADAGDGSKASEKEKMTAKQKLGWFWDYYKWYVLIPAAVLLAVVYTAVCLFREIGPVYVRVSMVNAVMEDETEVAFDDDFMQERQPDRSEGGFLVDTGLVQPETVDERNSGDTVMVASIQKYNALLTNGDTDITIASSWVLDQFAPSGSYYDLGELLPDEVLKRAGDRLYYCKAKDGKKEAVGIRLDGIDCVQRFYKEGDVPMLAISSRSKRTDHAIEVVDWLLKQ